VSNFVDEDDEEAEEAPDLFAATESIRGSSSD
jgi:hypothetical protein